VINYNPKNWLGFIFSLHKSDTIRILWKELIYIAILTAIITSLELHFFPASSVLQNLTTVYSLLGFVISLLLVFRTNTAYDRWWEGRRLWGAVVNDTRNLASLLSTLDLSKEEKDKFSILIIGFAQSMKEHLRRGKANIPFPYEVSTNAGHQPLWIAQVLREELSDLLKAKRIDSNQWVHISKHLDQLIDSLGACERILNTPIPFSYSLFFKKFIFIYVVTMPLAFVELFEYWSVLISTFVFYALVSMEILAEEIEDPFGTDDNDLPIDDICEGIVKGVTQLFQQSKQPV